jgi:hypothetical protein
MNPSFSSTEADEISSLSQHSQHSRRSYVSLSTEEEYDQHDGQHEECEEHEHILKRRKTSRVWDHFTHPAKVKGIPRSTCNHCRYYGIYYCASSTCFSFLNTCAAEHH